MKQRLPVEPFLARAVRANESCLDAEDRVREEERRLDASGDLS